MSALQTIVIACRVPQGSQLLDHAAVRNIFKKACEDYSISPSHLTLYLHSKEDKGVEGVVYPAQKKISFFYDKTCGRNAVTFGLYHEIGHCLDEELIEFDKRKTFYFARITGGVVASSVLLTALGFKTINYALDRYPTLQKYPYAMLSTCAATFLSAFGTNIYLASLFSRNHTQHFEHHANLAACKMLLKNNNVGPVAEYLVHLKAYASRNARTHFSHPLASDEYDYLKHCLEQNGYEVQLTEFKTKNKLNVTIFKGDESIVGYTVKLN